MIKKLIKLANHLDAIGEYDGADTIDRLVRKASNYQELPEYFINLNSPPAANEDYHPMYWEPDAPPRPPFEIKKDMEFIKLELDKMTGYLSELEGAARKSMEQAVNNAKRELKESESKPVDLQYYIDLEKLKQESHDKAQKAMEEVKAGKAVVWIDEDEGYKHYLWYPGLSPAKLELWWCGIETDEIEEVVRGFGELVEVNAETMLDLGYYDSLPIYHAPVDSAGLDGLLSAPDDRTILTKYLNESRSQESYDGQLNTENAGYIGGESPIGGGYSGLSVDYAQEADDIEQNNADMVANINGIQEATVTHNQHGSVALSDSYMYSGYGDLS